MVNYNGKLFRPVENSDNGQVSSTTLFRYTQDGSIVNGKYSGGDIVTGSLIAIVSDNGSLDMRYQHVDVKGKLKTGKCISIPEVLDDGRIRLHENWEWTCHDFTAGHSVIEEI